MSKTIFEMVHWDAKDYAERQISVLMRKHDGIFSAITFFGTEKLHLTDVANLDSFVTYEDVARWWVLPDGTELFKRISKL